MTEHDSTLTENDYKASHTVRKAEFETLPGLAKVGFTYSPIQDWDIRQGKVSGVQ